MFKKFLDHNAAVIIACVVCVLVIGWFYGCESQTQSLVSPEKKVNRAELTIEIDSLQKQADVRFADLDRQDILREEIGKTLAVTAETGTVNPLGVVTLIGSIFGIGAAATYRKKDTVIAALKNNNSNVNTKTG